MDKTLGVLYTYQMNPYLEQQLSSRYNLFKLYDVPIQNRTEFLKTHAQSIRAIVVNAFVGADAEMIELLPKVEIVASYSVGLDKVDLGKCKERGIRVTNTPDVLTDDVADLAIGLALSVMRKICEADRYVRSGSWKLKGDFKLTSKFSGKRMGIIGLGRIGSAIAKRAKAFGYSICYHSRSEKPSTNYIYYTNVVDLAANCDVLVVACSLNKETHHIIDRTVLDALGAHGVLVNIGRGAHVDEPELVSALLDGRLGGAGLDVFEHEPHVPEELFGLENVVIQSHVGSDTQETCLAMANLVLGNLEAHVLHRPLLTPVL